MLGKGLPSNYKAKCGIGCEQASGRHVPAALFMPDLVTLKNVADPVKAGFDTWASVCATIPGAPNKPYCGRKH